MAKRPDYHTDSPVTVRMPAGLLARLEALAAGRGQSRSAAIIDAVRDACDREEAARGIMADR